MKRKSNPIGTRTINRKYINQITNYSFIRTNKYIVYISASAQKYLHLYKHNYCRHNAFKITLTGIQSIMDIA